MAHPGSPHDASQPVQGPIAQSGTDDGDPRAPKQQRHADAFLYKVADSGMEADGRVVRRNFPLANREADETEAAHLVRVVRLVDEVLAAGGTHLLVPREYAYWLENHPWLVDYFATYHELAEASPETGIVFRLLQPKPVIFTVGEDVKLYDSTGNDDRVD